MGILSNHFGHLLDELSESEKYVFYELDCSPELIGKLTLSNLATHLSSSNSTIIRMTQKLGFDGFSQFKYEMKHLLSETIFIHEKDLLIQYQNFFQESLCLVTLENLEFFARKIYESANVFIVGVGLTKPIAEYISKRLYQLNKPSMYIYESHMLDLLPNLIHKNDLIIFVSMSGETKSLLIPAKKIKQKGGIILSITNAHNSSLTKISTRHISSGISANVYHHYDVTSRAFLMIQADLILELYLKNYNLDSIN